MCRKQSPLIRVVLLMRNAKRSSAFDAAITDVQLDLVISFFPLCHEPASFPTEGQQQQKHDDHGSVLRKGKTKMKGRSFHSNFFRSPSTELLI